VRTRVCWTLCSHDSSCGLHQTEVLPAGMGSLGHACQGVTLLLLVCSCRF
jgi:hypothetical protein